MKYYVLNSDKYIYKDTNNKSLNFLYETIIGRIILKILVNSCVSKICAKYFNSKLSVVRINKFIKKNNIIIDDFEEKKYESFNQFFIRDIKKEKRKIDDGLVSICDSKLSAFKIDSQSSFKIKNSIYTVNELLQEKTDIYNDGYALVFRLTADDYHHYIFPDNGRIVSSKKIDGILHTVQPLAFKKYRVFNENTRVVSFLECENYGKVCYIEIGAMLIGKITNKDVKSFKKGDEKGYFEFGGSTIVLLFQKGRIKLNEIILDNTKKDIETIVKLGQNLE